MPSNRSHIPTPETARKWPHLEQIAGKLMPRCEADIALLIGYNCPQALAPRDVIPPRNNEPFAQRTDLGWGIVGVVHVMGEENISDPVGPSHQIHSFRTQCDKMDVQISFQTSIKEISLSRPPSGFCDVSTCNE